MLRLLYNQELDKVKTIWSKDEKQFLNLIMNQKVFTHYPYLNTDGSLLYSLPRWRIIKDKSQIKQLLQDKCSSKGREGYVDGIPSPTVITDTLFPVDLASERFKLSWLNNVDIDEIKSSEVYNRSSLSLGTYIHKILELYLIDTRPHYERTLKSLIKIARTDKEILDKIADFQENMITYEQTALKTLPEFINNVLCKFDCIGSETYFLSDKLQGCVDMIGLKDNQYYICDFKTSRRINKATGKRIFATPKSMFSYHRQLCSYYQNMLREGLIPMSEKGKVKFNIFQFHLLSYEYRIYEIPSEDILKWQPQINQVQDWYWKMVA